MASKFKKLAKIAILANKFDTTKNKGKLGPKTQRSARRPKPDNVEESSFVFAANAVHRRALGLIPGAFDRLFTEEDRETVKQCFTQSGGIKCRADIVRVLPTLGLYPSAEQLMLALQAVKAKEGALLSLDDLVALVKRLLWVQMCMEPKEEECIFSAMGGRPSGKGKIKTERVQHVIKEFDLQVDVAKSLYEHTGGNSRAATPDPDPPSPFRLAALLRKKPKTPEHKDITFGEFEEMLESLSYANIPIHNTTLGPDGFGQRSNNHSPTSTRAGVHSVDSPFFLPPASPTSAQSSVFGDLNSPTSAGLASLYLSPEKSDDEVPFEKSLKYILKHLEDVGDGEGWRIPVEFVKPGCQEAEQIKVLTKQEEVKKEKPKKEFDPAIVISEADPQKFAKLLATHGLENLLRMTKFKKKRKKKPPQETTTIPPTDDSNTQQGAQQPTTTTGDSGDTENSTVNQNQNDPGSTTNTSNHKEEHPRRSNNKRHHRYKRTSRLLEDENAEAQDENSTDNNANKKQIVYRTIRHSLSRGGSRVMLTQPYMKKDKQKDEGKESDPTLLQNIEARAGLRSSHSTRSKFGNNNSNTTRMFSLNQRLMMITKRGSTWRRVNRQPNTSDEDEDEHGEHGSRAGTPKQGVLAAWNAAHKKNERMDQRTNSTILDLMMHNDSDYDVLDTKKPGNAALIMTLKPHQLRSEEYVKFALRKTMESQSENSATKKRHNADSSNVKTPKRNKVAQTPNTQKHPPLLAAQLPEAQFPPIATPQQGLDSAEKILSEVFSANSRMSRQKKYRKNVTVTSADWPYLA